MLPPVMLPFALPHVACVLVVPAATTVGLGGGSMNLGCTDVILNGTLDLQGGTLTNVRHVQIAAGGSLVLGSGSVSLAGNWSNAGTLNAGTFRWEAPNDTTVTELE